MKHVWKFLWSNKITVIAIFICLAVSINVVAGNIKRKNRYIEQLDSQLISMANRIDYMKSHPDNIDEDIRFLYESLIALSVFQNNAHIYVNDSIVGGEGFYFIYLVLSTGLIYNGDSVCNSFISDKTLTEGEIDFLNTFQNDLLNISNELNQYKKSWIYVNLRPINDLLTSFEKKYSEDSPIYFTIDNLLKLPTAKMGLTP